MAFVAANHTTADGATLNVTIDTGTSANRKAICLYAHQNVNFESTGTCVRDPAGAAESCTLERHSGVLNSGDAFYVMDSFYLDLSATGSQTFRFNTASGGPLRSVAMVVVWDGLASAAADVIESYLQNTPSTTVISDSITTLVANALIVQFAMRYSDTPATTPMWTPDNGQDERIDASYLGQLGVTAGTLVKAVAGSQTIGSTQTAATGVTGQHLLSYAPIPVVPPFGRPIVLGTGRHPMIVSPTGPKSVLIR